MAYQNKEDEKANAALYRAKNKERIKAKKKAWYEANKDIFLLACKARYEAKKPEILAQMKEYRERKGRTDEVRATERAWRLANIEKVRKANRDFMAAAYRADPMWAATKRAKTILVAQTGLRASQLDPALVEAKALQLLVRAEALYPGRRVGDVLTEAETKERRAESWHRWYEANKEHRRQYQREYRVRKASNPPLDA